MSARHFFVVTLAIILADSTYAHAQRTAPIQPWSGSARCEIAVQGPGYSEQQTHTWTLLGGAPTRHRVRCRSRRLPGVLPARGHSKRGRDSKA